jgi:low affinity Fe/Cu permease
VTHPDREPRHPVRERFSDAARMLAGVAGSAWASGISIIAVAGLLIVGLATGFTSSWQAFVFSVSSLVSMLVLFSIQHATNRQTKAILLKLDELVENVDDADNDVIAMEDRDLEDQEHIIRHQHHR